MSERTYGPFAPLSAAEILGAKKPLLRTVKATGWQPINTAPKNGTPILACRTGYKLYPRDGPITVYWGTFHPNSPGKKEWRDGNGTRRPYITHWMPLPEPPEED